MADALVISEAKREEHRIALIMLRKKLSVTEKVEVTLPSVVEAATAELTHWRVSGVARSISVGGAYDVSGAGVSQDENGQQLVSKFRLLVDSLSNFEETVRALMSKASARVLLLSMVKKTRYDALNMLI